MKNISNFDGFMSTPGITNYYSFTTYITSSSIAQNTTNGVSYDWETVGCGAGQYNQVNLPFGINIVADWPLFNVTGFVNV